MTRSTWRALSGGIGLLVLTVGVAGCGSGAAAGRDATPAPVSGPVAENLAAKAQRSCWFKVSNKSSRGEEVRLWRAAASTGATTERRGELLIVAGAMDRPVHEARYYGCSLYEYTPGSPVVMTALASETPVRADHLIPYGFSQEGRKELK